MRNMLVLVSVTALAVAGCEKAGSGGGQQAERPAAQPQAEAPALSSRDIEAAVTDPDLRRFYLARDWSPVWTKGLASQLKAAIADAPRHALRPETFFGPGMGGNAAQREAALTKAALDYAHALAFGVVDPAKLFDHYTVPRPQMDLAAGLQQAAQQANVGGWLASLAPSDPEYRALSDAFLHYRQRAGGSNQAPIPTGDKIHPGDDDPRLPRIVEALQRSGYVPPPQPPQPSHAQPKSAQPRPAPKQPPAIPYSPALVAAVKRVQADYGIQPDGVIGDSTLEALNNGAAERARILAVNLERRRWLNRAPPATRIDVNTAATILYYWRDGKLAHQAKVVDGQPDWETPQLGSPIFRLVANPDWTIPDKIVAEEIRPKGAAYMKKQHIALKNGRLVQGPGPTNSLGQVKFDMLNDQAIYLHDTPAKALFASEERHSSHGCVRVDDALGFARILANDEGVLDQFNQALATGKVTDVPLKQKIPVRLLYHTALAEGGRIVFRPDPYGWDDKVAAALGLGGTVRHRVIKHVEDVGP
jgi:murein L,D-transpeptidase YcbB/YkuD